ncbi:hypothetical protein AAMO2058_001515700 [Amorphochlora amoebiformis]
MTDTCVFRRTRYFMNFYLKLLPVLGGAPEITGVRLWIGLDYHPDRRHTPSQTTSPFSVLSAFVWFVPDYMAGSRVKSGKGGQVGSGKSVKVRNKTSNKVKRRRNQQEKQIREDAKAKRQRKRRKNAGSPAGTKAITPMGEEEVEGVYGETKASKLPSRSESSGGLRVGVGTKGALLDKAIDSLIAPQNSHNLTDVDLAKRVIAMVAESILEDPYRYVHKMTFFTRLRNSSPSVKIKKLALLTQVEIMSDLIPGYKIVLPSPQELNKTVNKQLTKERKYEGVLLGQYSRLVKFLNNKAKAMRNKQFNRCGIWMCVVRSLGRLLHRAHLFNLRKDIINATIPLLNHPNAQVRQIILESVVTLFKVDTCKESTLEVVRLISSYAATQGRSIRAEMLKTFLHLDLHKESFAARRGGGGDKRGGASLKSGKLTLKQRRALPKKGAVSGFDVRKFNREIDSKLEKDLKESMAVIDPKHRHRIDTQLISHVFTTYFRVLKKFPNSKALPVVLTGIAKFGNLINIDLVMDLLECLKSLLASSVGESTPTSSTSHSKNSNLSFQGVVQCLIAVFDILRNHHGVVDVDLMEYYTTMYEAINQMASMDNVRYVGLVIRCLSGMLMVPNLPKQRVLAFCKRLLMASLHLPPYAALGVMHLVNRVGSRYPYVSDLFDSEEGGQSGISGYQMELPDPDHANASQAVGWESTLVGSSYHPYCASYARDCLIKRQVPKVLLAQTPNSLVNQYDDSEVFVNNAYPNLLGKSQKTLATYLPK